MAAGPTRAPLPSPLADAQRRFDRWRRRCPAGTRIPPELWSLAVELAQEHGVSRTARALGLGHKPLRQHLMAVADGAPGGLQKGTGFVEVRWPEPVGSARCTLELGDSDGVRLRVELQGAETSEIEAVARALWSVAR